MRVLSVTLERFGALRGIFSFDPGITVIYGPNESGKSTLHTALRVALTGIDLPSRGRLPKESQEVLRRYRPWRGDSYTVQAEVELGSNRYRLIRDLREPDNCQVQDLVRGGDATSLFRRGRTVDVSVPLGMSREAFLAVATVAQDQILEMSGSSLQVDLQRSTSTSGVDTTVRSAIDLLLRWRQEHLRGDQTRTRPMDQLVKRLDQTKSALARAIAARERLGMQLGELEELRHQLEEAEAVSAAAELSWKAAELAELDQDLLAISEIDSSLAALPQVQPAGDWAQIREAAVAAPELAHQLQVAEAKIAELSPVDPERVRLAGEVSTSELQFLAESMDRPVPALPAQAGGSARLELLDRRSVAFHRWSSDVIATLGGALGLVLIYRAVSAKGDQFSVELFLGGLAAMVVAFSVFLILQSRLRRLLAVAGFTSVAEMRRARRSQDPEVLKAVAAQEEVLAQRARARKRLDEIRLPQYTSSQLRQLASELPPLQEALQQVSSWRATADRARDELLARAEKAGLTEADPQRIALMLCERAAEVEAAEEARRRQGELKLRREERLKARELRAMVALSQELRAEVGAKVKAGAPIRRDRPASELRVEYDQARSGSDQLRSQLLPMEGRLQQQLQEAGDLVELEEQAADLKAELERMGRAEAAVDLAVKELEHAEDEIQNTMAPVLAEGLSRWLPTITQQRYTKAWVDPASLAMHVATSDASRQVAVDSLSQGTQEQIYVCLRMVLAQALSPKGEPLPLFFDDPTVNSDDDRGRALLSTMLELSKTSQVVIFSHERRVAEWAQQNSLPLLALDQVPASPDDLVLPELLVESA